MRMGPGAHLHGLILPGGLRGEDFDYFHEIVVVQELTRINAPGYMAGVNAGMVIGEIQSPCSVMRESNN